MKKIFLTGQIAFFVLMFTSVSFADPLSLRLILESGFTSDFGNPVPSYEDVDEITGIGPRPGGAGPFIRHSDINAFNVPVKDNIGQALINKINSTGGRVLYEPGYAHFLMKFLYMIGKAVLPGDEDVNFSKFPEKYNPGNKPHTKEFFVGLNPGWDYIPTISYPPDAKSCDVKRDLCDYPPCIKEEKEDGDEDGDGESDEVIQPEEHHQPTNNVYKDLAAYLYGRVLPGDGLAAGDSGMSLVLEFKDRTPPLILGCVDGKFPELGKDKPATTGDWYQIEGLKVKDNDTKKIGSCLCLGKIDGFPGKKWEDSEDWINEKPNRLIDNEDDEDEGKDAEFVILPNTCHGAMRYSIFVWDNNGLLNPGEPLIVNDKPEICYGLRNPPGDADLGKDPLEAKPWPEELQVSFDGDDILAVDGSKLNPNDRRGEGLLHVKDNDLPNIVIKFKSVKDDKCLFFPPLIEPADLPVFPSVDYKGAGDEDKNSADYAEFLNEAGDKVFTSNLIDDAPMRFKIIDVKPSPVMTPGDIAILDKFKNPVDVTDDEFIRKNFRLEDYKESDTDLEGKPIIGNLDTFGKRNGFGGELVALLDTPLQEDVEYLVSVWSDDNVKWATEDESGKILEEIISIPTGIKCGDLKIEIPNQIPPAFHNRPLDPGSSISNEVKVVFREPTIPGGGKSESFYLTNRFPSITVSATDFSGLTRRIKLYLRVSNENPNIRILERQHEKR